MRLPAISSVIGAIALLFSLLAFAFGFAPFTPALVLTIPAVPLALIAAVYGAWRLGLLSLYFSAAAWLVAPLTIELSDHVDTLLPTLFFLGGVLSAVLLSHYRRR